MPYYGISHNSEKITVCQDVAPNITREAIDYSEKYGPVYECGPGNYDKMGISLEKNGCNFAIWAGTADIVDVCLFDSKDHNKAIERWRLAKTDKEKSGIFCGFIPNMKVGDLYGLRAHGEWSPVDQKIYNYNKLLIDPYARAITGNFSSTVDGQSDTCVYEQVDSCRNYVSQNNEDSAPYVPRCIVVDESYDWGNDKKPRISKGKTVLYEGHVKGITKLFNDIPEQERGKFTGVASKPFIEHLKKLGVTTLELMPVQHFVSEPHLQKKGLTNYWGYNTLGFFAPHADYAIDSQHGEQVKEFKDMVKSLHESNIEVILDVVYNHTPEGGESGPTLMFKGLDERELYHFDNNKKLSNYSGCGNTVNASSDAGLNFILESLHYWAEDMHVDGFRFDLATILAREQPNGDINMHGRFMNALQNDPVLNKLKIIAEPWDCAGYELGEFDNVWSEWNDKFRDSMRDYWIGDGNLGEFASKLAGSFSAGKVVNFITAHDGFTLNDLVSYSCKHNLDNCENGNDGTDNNRSFNFGHEGSTDNAGINERRIRVMRSMLLSMFIAAGTPMLSHGDEIMRTQNGNNNAYCQDSETSWMHWDLLKDQQKFFDYVSDIIHFRKAHPVFGKTSGFTGNPVLGSGSEADVAWFRGDGHQFEYNDNAWQYKGTIGMYMSGIALNSTVQLKTDYSFLYYANGTHEDQEIYLPKQRPYAGNYEVIIDSSTGEVLPVDYGKIIETNRFVIKALSAVVLKRTSSHLFSQK